MRRSLGTAVLVGVDGAVLRCTAHAPTRAVHELTHTGPAATIDHLAADLCAAGLFVAALWLAAGLITAALGHVPGAAGRLADRVTRLLLPSALYRVVAGATGLGILLAPVATAAATATPASPGAPAPTSPTPVWPMDPATPTVRPATPPTQPTPSTSVPGTPGPRVARGGTVVTVAAGDSLWAIAGRRLGPHAGDARLARLWPRIYATNRSVIGDDPALIHPGQRLSLPPVPAEEQS